MFEGMLVTVVGGIILIIIIFSFNKLKSKVQQLFKSILEKYKYKKRLKKDMLFQVDYCKIENKIKTNKKISEKEKTVYNEYQKQKTLNKLKSDKWNQEIKKFIDYKG